jgi:hypothetical protein
LHTISDRGIHRCRGLKRCLDYCTLTLSSEGNDCKPAISKARFGHSHVSHNAPDEHLLLQSTYSIARFDYHTFDSHWLLEKSSSQHYDILPLISSFLPMASPFTSAALPLACPAVSSAVPFAFEALMLATSAALFFASTVGRGQCNWVLVDAGGRFARVHRWDVERLLSLHLLPASMPLTATSDTVRSTAFRPSLTVSVADFW